MYVRFSSGKSHGIQITLHVQERIINFCLTNHMDAHVGECLAIHHLGLVPDWGGGKEQEEDELQGYYYKPKSSWAVV